MGFELLSEIHSYTLQISKSYCQPSKFSRDRFSVNPSTAQKLLLSHILKQVTRIKVQYLQVYIIFSHLLLSGKLDPFPWCQVTKQISRDSDHSCSTLHSSWSRVPGFLFYHTPSSNLCPVKTILCNNLSKSFLLSPTLNVPRTAQILGTHWRVPW